MSPGYRWNIASFEARRRPQALPITSRSASDLTVRLWPSPPTVGLSRVERWWHTEYYAFPISPYWVSDRDQRFARSRQLPNPFKSASCDLPVPDWFDFETLGCLSRWRGSIREVIERIGRLFNDWVPISLSLTCNNRFTSAPAPVAASASPSPKYWPRSACRISAAGESLFPFGLAPRETEARWLTRSPRDGPPP